MPISIRVTAKTAPGEYRVITVADDGSDYACDCTGLSMGFCAHVDAVLVAQERAMVHSDDWAAADKSAALVGAHLSVPAEWKGSWRKNLRWRGLSSRGATTRRVRDSARPLVCFTGTLDQPRAALIAEAVSLGWETIDSASPYIDVLVAADPRGASGKLKAARKNGTPIVTREEWSVMITDGAFPE